MSIPIPPSVALKRNRASEKLLLAKSREWLEGAERQSGWHASDIINPRKGFWKHIDPQAISDREVPIFLVGKVLHAFVLGAMNNEVNLAETDEGSSFSEDLGIWYSPDWDKGKIAELKTSRVFKEPETIEDVSGYLEQVLIYMAAKNRTEAELWLLLLNLKDKTRRTSPEFRAYRIVISQEDLEATKAKIKETRGLLEKAVATSDHTILPLCWDYICRRDMCIWFDQCKPEGKWRPN